jgi:NAD(P)-dependent dehydrogenase (short-subunit alcohol dehydrogenase family)
MFDLGLKDKVAVITGGSDGLGFASAQLLSEHGAKVVICGRRGEYLKEKAQIISNKTNNEVLNVQADVSNADDCKKLIEDQKQRIDYWENKGNKIIK